MTGSKPRDSCNPVFQTLEIQTVPPQYLLSSLTFLIHILEHFTFHPSIHSNNKKKKLQKHRPLANPVSYQKGVHYVGVKTFNPLNPELNPICYLLALLGAHHFLHVSRIRVKSLTFMLLISYIYMEHPFLMFLDHTQRRSTVGRTPLDE